MDELTTNVDAFKIASGLADEGATVPELNVPTDSADATGFRAQLDNAVASLTEGNVHPNDLDPTTAEMIGAAFRQTNTVVSALTSHTLAEQLFPTPNSKELTDDELLAKLKADGRSNQAGAFMDVWTEAQYEAKAAQLDQEAHDQQILAASGIPGVVAQFAAGAIDAPMFLPIGAGVRVAQGVKAIAKVAGGSALAAGASEAALQVSQESRSIEDSAFNIGAATVLGSGLGLAVHKIVAPRTAARITENLDAKFDDMRAGNPKANAAGAQAVTVYRELRDRGLLDTERVNALGADTVLKNLGTPFRKLGLSAIDQGLRNPVLDLMDSSSRTAREFVTKFVSLPWITKANVAGEANPENVAGLVSQHRGRLAGFMREAETEYRKNKAAYRNREDFAERVYHAAIRGDVAEDGDEFVSTAAMSLRKHVFEPIRKHLVEAGLLKDDAAVRGAQSYVPRVYNKVAVAAKKERFLEIAEEWAFARIQAAAKNGEEGVPIGELAQRKAAVEVADDIFGTITATKPRDTDYAPTTTTRGFLKGRVFDVPDRLLADEGFLIKNVFDLAQRYVRTAGTDASIARVFSKIEKGADEAGNAVEKSIGDVKLSSVIEGVNKEFDELIGRASGDDLQKLGVERDRIIAGIENLRDIARGTFLPGNGGDLARTAELVAMFNYVRLLGGTVVSSLADPVNLVIANGFGQTMRYGVVPLLKDFKSAMRSAGEDMRRLSRLSGAVAELELNSRVAALGDFDDLYATGDRALSFMRNLSNTFSKVSGISYWNTFWKQVAYNVTQARIIQNVQLGIDKLGTSERAWIANLGIGPDQAAEILEAYNKQVGRKVVAGDLPYANHELWPTKAGDVFRSALANEANNVIVTPQLGDRPIFAATPVGRLLFQFRSYTMASQARLIGRHAQLAALDETGARKAAFGAGLFGLVMMSAVVDGLKRGMSSNDVDFDAFLQRWQDHPGESLYRALDRSAIIGVIAEGSSILDRAGGPSLSGGLKYAFGDLKPEHPPRDMTVFGALGVPTINLIEDAGTLAFQDVPRFASSGELSQGAFRRARAMVPFANVPGIQQGINAFQSEVGSVWDWPN